MKLIIYPDEILDKTMPVVTESLDDKIIEKMSEIQQDHFGAGISANQVGIEKRFFVVNDYAIVNPKIVSKSGHKIANEGCLSLPNVNLPIKRYTKITVEYQDKKLNKRKQTFKGGIARIIQHEIDHLNGILIWDRNNDYKTKFIKKMYLKNQ